MPSKTLPAPLARLVVLLLILPPLLRLLPRLVPLACWVPLLPQPLQRLRPQLPLLLHRLRHGTRSPRSTV